MIFEFSQKWQIYVNNLSVPYRMPLVGSKLVHKRAGNTWSKKYLKLMVFAPLLRIFEIIIIIIINSFFPPTTE